MLFAVGALGAMGCGRDSDSNADSATGWWITPQTGACFCPPQPECAAGDCVSYSVLGLLPDKRYYDGQVSISKHDSSMSSVGSIQSGTYRVDRDSIVISQAGVPDASLRFSASGGQLNLGTRLLERAPPNLAAALDAKAAGDRPSWKSARLPQ
jgi:hypothetical protein